MKLNPVEASLDAIPEAFHVLYTQEGDSFKLTGVVGLKTDADIERLTGSLTKERNDHRLAKEALRPYIELGDIDTLKSSLTKLTELEAAGTGTFDENKVAEVAEARVKALVRPLEAEKTALQQQLAERDKLLQQHQAERNARLIRDAVEAEISKAKIVPEHREHVQLLAEKVFIVNDEGKVVTRENAGCTPFLDVSVWLSERQPLNPYWWGQSQGGGSMGGSSTSYGGATNPWNPATLNLTKQGEIYTNNKAEAVRLAAMHGVTIN